MAGETVKTLAICLAIRPWSRTSHVVWWLTPHGRVATVVKGAVRPKSQFLGQYDLNYTCEILYYARGKGELHALRECSPLDGRERLRGDYRALIVADYFRRLVSELAPAGEDCRRWYELLGERLDGLSGAYLRDLLSFELEVLRLAGLAPDLSGYDPAQAWQPFNVADGSFAADGGEGRQIRLSREVTEFLRNPSGEVRDPKIPLDAARAIGVFYSFHLDCASEARRAVLRMIS